MTDESITPILRTEERPAPAGRRVDIFAALLAGLGAVLSIAAAFWFFLGFAENDTRPEHLASALSLTLILFAFGIIPFVLVARFAERAYRRGANRGHLLWTLFLMLPWVVLGSLAVSHTPLPVWCGFLIAGLAALLTLWALVSFILDRNISAENTEGSQQNEVSDSPE